MRTSSLLNTLVTAGYLLPALLAVTSCNPYSPDLDEEPFICGPSDACPDGYVCDTDVDICVVTRGTGPVFDCNDDSPLEPNDTFGSAYNTPVADQRASIPYASLSICTFDDVDNFSVTIPINGYNLSATVDYDPSKGGKLALSIYNVNEVLIKNGTDDGAGTITVDTVNLASGDYYVQVYSEDDPNNYDLEITSSL